MRKTLGLAFGAVLALAAGRLSASTWTIPGTVNTSGLNGTRFVSDLALTNPGTDPAFAILTLVPAGGTVQSLQLLAPGQTLVFHNVLQQLWGATGAFATVVDSPSPLLLRARTYNAAASGTYGVALPVVADDGFLSTGDAADSLWVSQSPNGSAGYRTNVAVVFPDAAGGDATVTVYDAAGAPAGAQAFSLPSAGFQQFAVGSFAGAVTVGRARIEVTRGPATAYAVVVDNVTGDSSLFTFENLPAGPQDVLVNGVARAGGRNNTFFRTDARIYNPGATNAVVSVAYHANQNANPSPASATFDVPAGQIRDVVDVLASLLSLPVGSAGALRFTTDAPVAILCRTSNVDPSGANPGTYGAQQRPVPIPSFLSSADAGAVVTGIRQGTDFRTNVGFAAGGDGAAYALTLENASGIPVGTATGSLGPWGWTQPNVQDLFGGVTIPADATLRVTVASGSVDVFDSSIDNASGDPVVTPIMPLPVAIPSTATIGPAGGSVRSDDGRLTLKIPAGALAAPTSVVVTPAADVGPNAIGPAYSISPPDLAFSKAALLVFDYGRDDVAADDAQWLIPGFLGGDGQWYSSASWSIDSSAREVTTSLATLVSPHARAPGRGTLAGGRSVVQMLSAGTLIGPYVVSPTESPRLYRVGYFKGMSPGRGSTAPILSENLTGYQIFWYVDGIIHGNSTIGNIDEAGTPGQAFYRPPACPQRILLQAALVKVGEESVVVHKEATVFPKDWDLSLTERRHISCIVGSNAHTASYSVSGVAKQHFLIDDDGNLHEKELEIVQPTYDFHPVGCGQFAGCTLTATDAPTGLSISKVTGRIFGRSHLTPVVTYYKIGEPPLHVHCDTNPPFDKDFAGITGQKETTDTLFIGAKGTDPPVTVDASAPGIDHTFLWSFKPRDPGSCP